jgi:uncharacterized protein (DUF885 family)
MRGRHAFVLAFLFSCVWLACAGSRLSAQARPAGNPRFAAFVDEYFDALFQSSPSLGTAAGLHQYDAKLEDLSADAVARRVRTVKAQQGRLRQLRRGHLTADEAIDADILDSLLRAELHEVEEVQTWRMNPMNYMMVPGNSVDLLIKRSFAPPAERLRSVIARLKVTPAVFQALRANVHNPPREFTDLALIVGQGSVGFLRDTVPEWAKNAAGGDANLLKDFEAADHKAVEALKEALAWLKKDLLPNSRGSYALGAEKFRKKLLYEEMVHLPLDKLLAIGEANLRKDHDAFVATARKINPNKTPHEVMKALSDDHPSEADLIPSARRTVETIRRFFIDKQIVTIPSEVRPRIEETPPYARNGGFASMDTPGPYETRATEAFYYVTPPEKDWDAKHKEEHLRAFAGPIMQLVTIHEAFPGHYIQFLYAKQYPTKTRKLATCGTNVEGWAHYTEQMMVDEGYGGRDPKIRLAQLEEALLRDCRYVVGIKLHTQGMTVQQGAQVFVEKGFQEPANAYEEARRGAYNPTYLYYTLGKLQILKLRDDYRKAKGQVYSLRRFHDDFVKQGGIPIPLVRRILLPGDKRSPL